MIAPARARASSPEQKSRSLSPERRCVPTCPTWRVINKDSDPEIQRCDGCWAKLPLDDQLTDAEAATLEGARVELRHARDRVAKRRELAIGRRRVAVVEGDTLISPCCHVSVVAWTLITRRMMRDYADDGRQVASETEHACSGCGRLLQLPPGFVL